MTTHPHLVLKWESFSFFRWWITKGQHCECQSPQLNLTLNKFYPSLQLILLRSMLTVSSHHLASLPSDRFSRGFPTKIQCSFLSPISTCSAHCSIPDFAVLDDYDDDGVKLHLWTVATSRPIVYPLGGTWAWRTMMEWYRQGKTPDSSTRALWQ
jgi:hypothetical protein